MEKVETVHFGCYYALWYNNASKFNPCGILSVKVFWWPSPKVTCQLSVNIFPLKLLGQFHLNFILAKGERKFIYLVQVNWPRWPPCQYMVKTLKIFLQNHWADCLETWYVAFWVLVLWNLYKWWPCVAIDPGLPFLMQPSSKGRKKVYIFRPSHLAKMAAMPIFGKNKTSSSPEPLGQLPWNLICSILYC